MKRIVIHRMKRLGMLIAAILMMVSFSPVKAEAHAGWNMRNGTFYHELAPYGTWTFDAQYGNVWVPAAGPDFRPYYTDGYWVNTVYGNMWVSNYEWGWAPFHYGRWVFKNRYGWAWVPGYTWAPAWVTWRQGGGYYGWAPMGPGVTIQISFGSNYYVPNSHWTFIPYGNLYAHNIYHYYRPSYTTNIIYNTTIINNTYVDNGRTYVAGPSRRDIKLTTGRDVRTYDIDSRPSSGRSSVDGNRVAIYRPEVSASPNRREIGIINNNQPTDRDGAIASGQRASDRGGEGNNASREVSRPENASSVGRANPADGSRAGRTDAERSGNQPQNAANLNANRVNNSDNGRAQVKTEKPETPNRSTMPVNSGNNQKATVPTNTNSRSSVGSPNTSAQPARSNRTTSGSQGRVGEPMKAPTPPRPTTPPKPATPTKVATPPKPAAPSKPATPSRASTPSSNVRSSAPATRTTTKSAPSRATQSAAPSRTTTNNTRSRR